jgi:thiamine biosynthesis lipoprotein
MRKSCYIWQGFSFACLLTAVLFFGTGCSKKDTSISMTGFYFDTVVQIELWGTEDTTILEECKRICEEKEALLSRTREGSDIWRLNHANGEALALSEETLYLLRAAKEYAKQSDGMFDITIAPLQELWDIPNRIDGIPSQEEIDEVLLHVNIDFLEVEDGYARLTDPEAAVDLGGIAKGYIADYLKTYLVEQGVTSAMINLGGNVLAIGGKPSTGSFTVGVQRPFTARGESIESLQISDLSVVSSGVYERYLEWEGIQYHHILNPKTGYPVQTDLYQATILSQSSMEGDAWSTIAVLLGSEEAEQCFEQRKEIEAILVTDTYEVIDLRE